MQALRSNRKLLRTLWAVCVLTVAVGTLLPAWSAPITAISQLGLGDKILHFGAYLGLAFLPVLHERRRVAAGILFFLVLLGLSLDLAQRFSAGRSPEAADVGANCAGLLAGGALGKVVRRRLRTTSAAPARKP